MGHCISLHSLASAQLTSLVLLPSLSEFLFDVCPSSSSQRSWKEGWRWPTILFSVTLRPSSGGTSWTKAPIPQCFSRWTHLTVNVCKMIIMGYFCVLLCPLCSAGYLLSTSVCVCVQVKSATRDVLMVHVGQQDRITVRNVNTHTDTHSNRQSFPCTFFFYLLSLSSFSYPANK